jgi:glycosyltransferase DesVII
VFSSAIAVHHGHRQQPAAVVEEASMRVLFVTIPENTHLYSMVPLAWAFTAAGHEVRVASTPSFTERVTRSGLTAVPVGEDSAIHTGTMADRQAQEVEEAGWSELDPAKLTYEGELERFRYGVWGLEYYNSPFLEPVVEYARFYQPDLVIWDALSFAGAVAATAVGAAHARFLSYTDVWGAKRKLFLDLLAEQKQPEDPFVDWLGACAEKQGFEFSEELVVGQWTIDPLPSRLAVPTGGTRMPIRFTPYNGPAVIPDWLRRPAERPRVGVSLGTANTERYGGDYVSKTDLFEALADLDAEVVAALLPAQRDELGTLPDNVRVVSSVPLHALFPTCSAAVHHGGFGTFATALAAGVPALSVATPFADNPLRCRLLEQAGGGLYLPHVQATAETIGAGVRRLLTEPSFAEGAARLRDEALAHPTPAQFVTTCEQLAAERP